MKSLLLVLVFAATAALALSFTSAPVCAQGLCGGWMCNSDADCGPTCRCWFRPVGVGRCG